MRWVTFRRGRRLFGRRELLVMAIFLGGLAETSLLRPLLMLML